jgi:hypothetical protein
VPRTALRIAHDHAGIDAAFFRFEERIGGGRVWSVLRGPGALEQIAAGQIAGFLPELREPRVLSRSRTRRIRRDNEQSRGRCDNDQNPRSLTHPFVIPSTLRAIGGRQELKRSTSIRQQST